MTKLKPAVVVFALLLTVLTLTALTVPTPAHADYVVTACDNDDGTGANNTWAPSANAYANCQANAGLFHGVSGNFGVFGGGGWTFTTAADVQITDFSYNIRIAWNGKALTDPNDPGQDPAHPRCSVVDTGAPSYTALGGPGCIFGNATTTQVFPGGNTWYQVLPTVPPTGNRLRIVSYCGAAVCTGPNLTAENSLLWTSVEKLHVTLVDPTSPVLSDVTTGGLVSGLVTTPLTGVQSAHFPAEDSGSGIASWRVRVDDAVIGSGNNNCDYSQVTPCPTSFTPEFSYNTSALSDGTHTVEYSVVNASGDRALATHDITTENHAPSVTIAPILNGTAATGNIMGTSDGTWKDADLTAVALYQWQSCKPDGSSCKDISGATLPMYTITAADVGFVLRAKITLIDNSGTGTAFSNLSPVIVAGDDGGLGGTGGEGPGGTGGEGPGETPTNCRKITGLQGSMLMKMGRAKVRLRASSPAQLTDTDELKITLRAGAGKVKAWSVMSGRTTLASTKLSRKKTSSVLRVPAASLPEQASSLTVRIKPKRGAVRSSRLRVHVQACA